MTEPDVVPERLKNPINIKILVLIIGATIAFQIFVSTYPDDDALDVIISIVSFVNPLAASISGFVIAKRYTQSQIFGKAYLLLSVGYLMVFLAEITYLAYDLILGLDPYPSIADVFFFMFYPLALSHLILNIRFFSPSTSKKTKTWMVALSGSIIGIWLTLSLSEGEINFDFYYGLAFIIISSVTVVFAVLGASIFRQGVLGIAWLLVVIGILANTSGDVWYYYLEIFGGYDLTHPVNLFWYAGYWIIVYALYKHKEII